MLVASLLVGASPAQATCPKDLAGKLDKEQMPALTIYGFNWSEMFTETVIGDDDKLVLDLSVLPWGSLSTIFYPLSGSGQEFAQIDMDAQVEGGMAHGVPFEPGKWNDVTVSFDFEAQTFVVNINGISSDPVAFINVAESIKGLQVYGEASGATETAWLDSVRLRYTPDGGSPMLLHQVSFDDGTAYSPSLGTVTSMDPDTRGDGRRRQVLEPAHVEPEPDSRARQGERKAASGKEQPRGRRHAL